MALSMHLAIFDAKEKKKNRNSSFSDQIRDASLGIPPNKDDSIASTAEAMQDAACGAWDSTANSA
eukprot:10865764-Ditylum_brightwellii.AAC.1